MAADELNRTDAAQAREGAVLREDADDDTEGHSMLPNMGISRQLAQARERDVQQHLKRHELEADARAHKKIKP